MEAPGAAMVMGGIHVTLSSVAMGMMLGVLWTSEMFLLHCFAVLCRDSALFCEKNVPKNGIELFDFHVSLLTDLPQLSSRTRN